MLGLNPNGVETAAIGGSKTTNDTVTIAVYDTGISGGSKAETYTVLSTDTLTSIAAGLASTINGDSALSALGITATSAATVVNIRSISNNATTYAKSTSGGATETITLGYSTGVTQSTYNNLNELTATSGGGATRFSGTTNKAIKSANVNSVAATLPTSTSFNASPVLSTGNNSSTVAATDGANNTVTNTYQVSVKGGPSATLTYDANGYITSDGTNTYSWDAENRMIQITYPGSGNNSQFSYDGLNRNTEIVERTGGSVTSSKQFVWCGEKRCEQRNSSSTITAQFFILGESIGGTSYFWTKDEPGSIREMTNSSGTIQNELLYDAFGRATQLQGNVNSDFQFAGYYAHVPSALNMPVYRSYSPQLGRFLSRDILNNSNLYSYASNSPVMWIDPSGWDYVAVNFGGLGQPALGTEV